MKVIHFLILVLGASAPSNLFSQGKNRISLQTGLFHCFFDGTPIVNKIKNNSKKNFSNLFAGIFTESKGIKYDREVSMNTYLCAELMTLSATYNPVKDIVLNVDPFILTKKLNKFNLSFEKKISKKQLKMMFGLGINCNWGSESIFLFQNWSGWGYEAKIIGFSRKDFGLNIRSGLEYHPKKWLTLFTNIDFIGIVFLNTADSKGMNTNTFYKEKYGMKNVPSRTDLSLRFGIGFNF